MTHYGYTLFCEGNDPRSLVEQAVGAERAGFDFLVISDHYHPWLSEQEHSPDRGVPCRRGQRPGLGTGRAGLGALGRPGAGRGVPPGPVQSWRLRLQPTPPGWVDMGLGVPIVDCTRVRRTLGWSPTQGAEQTLLGLLEGIRGGATEGTPATAGHGAAPR